MSDYPPWQYDEMKQIGTDYGDPAEVEAYDMRHARFRNVEKENDDILAKLSVQPEDVLIDIGTGTGKFALQAARRCARVYAVDVSPAMLDFARLKATKAGVTNIVFCYGGFLTYFHEPPTVDAVVTSTALHHLPDFWKGMALLRLNGMLKSGGRLYLSDVVFDHRNLRENIERFIGALEKAGGPEMREDIESHIRNEHSTYGWIMEGLLERAGFRITDKTMHEGVIGRYLCRKEKECACW
jgi:putative AdoMet-dependent methyltransferase